MRALGERELTTMEVSRVAKVSYTFLLNILSLLKAEGILYIIESKTDRRVKFVRLTDAGKYLLETLEMYRATLQGNYDLIKRLTKK